MFRLIFQSLTMILTPTLNRNPKPNDNHILTLTLTLSFVMTINIVMASSLKTKTLMYGLTKMAEVQGNIPVPSSSMLTY